MPRAPIYEILTRPPPRSAPAPLPPPPTGDEDRKGRYQDTIIPKRPGGQRLPPIGLTTRPTLALASPTHQRQSNVAALNEACRVVLGNDRIGAQLLTGLLTVPNTGNLLVVCIWCRGPVNQITQVTVGNVDVELMPTVGKTHYTGTTSQTVDPKLVSAYAAAGLTHTFAFPGIAYSVLEFPPGITVGEIQATIAGVRAYDPRNGAHVLATPSTWTFSQNPAILLAHVISNTVYGLGGTMDWSGSVNAFDACDVAMADGSPKRLLGYTLDQRIDSNSVCDILRAHAGCFVVRSAGKFKLIPDRNESPVATISKATNTLVEKSVRWNLAGLKQQPNVVEVNYTDRTVIPWRVGTAVYPANALPPAGEELRLARISMPGVQTYAQAVREVTERLNHGRLEALTVTSDTYAESLKLEPGDVYNFDDGGALGFLALRLISKTMTRKGKFTLVGRKFDGATYSNAVATAPTYPNTTLPDPFGAPPAVTGLTLTELVVTNDSAVSPLSRIQATWTASTWPYVAGYLVTVTDDTSSEVILFPPTLQRGFVFTSPSLPSPRKYKVKVSVMSTTNVLSAETTSGITLLLSSTIFEPTATIAVPTTGWTVFGATQTASTAKFTSRGYGVAPATRNDTRAEGDAIIIDQINSPYFDLGNFVGGLLSLSTFSAFTSAFPGYVRGSIRTYDENANLLGAVSFDGLAVIPACRYIRLTVIGNEATTPVYISGTGLSAIYSHEYYKWQFDITGDSFKLTSPVTAENATVTTSASASVTATLANRYLKITGVQATAESVTQANPSYSVPVIGSLLPNKVNVDCYDSANARIVKPVSLTVFGVRGGKTLTDWARSANGATITSSGDLAGYPASSAISGNLDPSVTNWWNSALATGSRKIEVTFAAAKDITEIVVVGLRDAYTAAGIDSVFTTGTLYLNQSFTVSYWNGSAYVVITGGTVTGNTKIMNRFPVTVNTTKIKVDITVSPYGDGRVVALQAIGPA